MRRMIVVGCTALTSLLVPSAAQATPSGVITEQLSLDSNSQTGTGYAGPATTAATLLAGKAYAVVVSGTFSPYRADLWNGAGEPSAVPCGTPEQTPAGAVGQDAEIEFAKVEAYGCTLSYPFHVPDFQMNFSGDASGWQLVEPAAGAATAPASDHTYYYLVTGQDAPAAFRLLDSNTKDNYGTFSITVTSDKSVCKKDGWMRFGDRFKNQGNCVSYFEPPDK
jgi:hypothetical protein